MKHFFEVLTSEGKHKALSEEFDYFGKLIDSWKIDYVDNSNSSMIKGEWHFSWILEGRQYRMLLSYPNLNMEQRFVSTIRVHTLGMLHIAIQEKLCGLKQESKKIQ